MFLKLFLYALSPALALSCQFGSPSQAGSTPGGSVPEQSFSYQSYAQVLETYVDARGLVDYRGLKDNRVSLDSFVESLAGLSAEDLEKSSRQEKIAFWINAYNALTLRVIVDHYPIKGSFLKGLVYPRNSIRQIPGAWDGIRFPVAGRQLTLDQIEHEIIRPVFDEPRIHVALVCAAMGCPPLLSEPFRGSKLDEQLERQAREFLTAPQGLKIDQEKKRVRLSSIFRWYGEDFVSLENPSFGGRSGQEAAVLRFVAGRLPEPQAAFLAAGDYRLEYLEYDWSLNEQRR